MYTLQPYTIIMFVVCHRSTKCSLRHALRDNSKCDCMGVHVSQHAKQPGTFLNYHCVVKELCIQIATAWKFRALSALACIIATLYVESLQSETTVNWSSAILFFDWTRHLLICYRLSVWRECICSRGSVLNFAKWRTSLSCSYLQQFSSPAQLHKYRVL